MESIQKAFAATFFISVVPNIFLYLVPSKWLLQSKNTGNSLDVSSLFLSFACGGLLGDVFIHIIPHLLGAHSHGPDGHGSEEHHNSEEDLFADARSLFADANADTGGNGHGHSGHDEHSHSRSTYIGVSILIGFIIFFTFEKIINSVLMHNHKKTDDKKKNLQVAGWLNIAADCMHNFTDGLAIGATFAAGGGVALATSISVFFHEIPHEIGDFSVLIRSGMR